MVTWRRTRARINGLVLMVGVAVLVAACGSSSSSSSSSSAAAASPSTSSSASSAPAAGLAIGAVKGADGTYLVGPSGRALYLWVADKNGTSSCSGACAKVWPPVIAKATPTASGGVNVSDLGTITRSDGSKQVTYMGHPLYYYVADAHAGMTTGQGSNSFGAKWWLVAPSGTAITAGGKSSVAAPGGSSTGSSSGSSSGSSWG
jgi:predicted lipoprotein with Yx(FWY)xxD motif